MTVACIVKAVLMSTKLNKMVETGIGSPEWAENIIKKVLILITMKKLVVMLMTMLVMIVIMTNIDLPEL